MSFFSPLVGCGTARAHTPLASVVCVQCARRRPYVETGETSQSVTTTLLAGSSWTKHTLLFFYFEYGDYLCNVVFLFFSLVFRQGPHLRMMFFSLRFSPLLLVVDLDENGPRC